MKRKNQRNTPQNYFLYHSYRKRKISQCKCSSIKKTQTKWKLKGKETHAFILLKIIPCKLTHVQCSRNLCRLCHKSIVYISAGTWYLQRVWKFTSKYLLFVKKKSSKCLTHSYEMTALGLGKTEGMFHPWYGSSSVARRQWLPRSMSAHTPRQLPPLYWAKPLCLIDVRKSHRCFSQSDINIHHLVNLYWIL